MKVRLKYIKFIMAMVIVCVLAITAGCTQQANNIDSNSNNNTPIEKSSAIDSSSSELKVENKNLAGVIIYFPDINGEKLIPAQRQINLNREDKYQAVVQALIDGPISDKEGIYIMPKDTKVLSVTVKNNIATVDFNQEFKTNFTGGSTGELMLIGSIVNSLTEFEDIKAVRFTINGKVLEALDGHLDLIAPQQRMEDLF